jgi:hypothetical protein
VYRLELTYMKIYIPYPCTVGQLVDIDISPGTRPFSIEDSKKYNLRYIVLEDRYGTTR